jgi:hypothetical protein
MGMLEREMLLRRLGSDVLMMRDVGNVMGMMERLGVFVVCARYTATKHHCSGS